MKDRQGNHREEKSTVCYYVDVIISISVIRKYHNMLYSIERIQCSSRAVVVKCILTHWCC